MSRGDLFRARRDGRRVGIDRVVRALAGAGFGVSMTLVVLLVGDLAIKGFPALSWTFLTEATRDGGLGGGILYQILGTMILISTAGCITAPLALGLALVQTEYLRHRGWRTALHLVIHSANAIPSILYGVFGFFVIVKMAGLEKSWLAGGIVLGMMILPTTTVAVQEAIEAIPPSYREQAAALGLSKPKEIFAIVLPQSFFGLVTGLLLGLSRAAGETAPVMFTACVFFGPTLPRGVRDEPILSLPYHIFNLAQDSLSPEAMQNAWGSTLVLLLIVTGLSLTAGILRRLQTTEARR